MKKSIAITISYWFFFTGVLAQTESNAHQNLAYKLDSIVSVNMHKYNVVGVSYALFDGGTNFYGYKGLSNIDRQQPVDANTTFMLGSIAKLFTTVAVLQLYEQDKVALDNNINEYLRSIQIPYEVTLRQLLTHTAGLEESAFDRVRLSSEEMQLLDEYLESHLPEQIFTPGKYPAYSNHGMALAGLVVQEVSGVPFEEYIKQNIFEPLDMNQSSFELSSQEKKTLATPYQYRNGKFTQSPYEYVQTIPASMLISNANDMAKFLAVHINRSNSSLLKPETLSLMQSRQFSSHENLWGRALGFFERNYRGVTFYEHGGTRNGYFSNLIISPINSLGVFITYTGGDSAFRNKVIFDLLKSIYPKVNREKNFSNEEVDVSEYLGTYLSNRRSKTDFSKLLLQASFVEKIKVEKRGGQLRVFGSSYQMEAKDQFEISDDSTASFPIAFGRDETGTIDSLYLPGRSDSLLKMKWYQNEMLGIAMIGLSLLAFLMLTISVSIQLVKRRISFNKNEYFISLPIARFLYSSVNSLFLISLISVLIIEGENMRYSIPSILYPVFGLSIAAFILLFPVLFVSIRNWNSQSTKTNMQQVMFLLLSFGYTWQLYFWNLLGFNF